MVYLHPAAQRGNVDIGWLQSHHSFSFGHYYHPDRMGFSVLRVINDDVVSPGAGFDTHGHRDMEIISIVLEGAVSHKDNQGHAYTVPAGDVQHMSAGRGIMHSEFNASLTNPLRFVQIWITPDKTGYVPSYAQTTIVQSQPLTPLVTASGVGNSLTMRQDANIYRLELQKGETIQLENKGRWGYLHVIEGEGKVNTNPVNPGDAVGTTQEPLHVIANDTLTALWFDLPPIG